MRAPGRSTALWLCVVVALSAALAANIAAPRLAAAALRDEFRRALAVPQVTVAVDAWPPLAVWWGRMDRITVHASRVPAGEIELAQFRATFHDVRLDPAALYRAGRLVVRTAGPASADAIVPEASLAAAIRRRAGVRLDRLTLRRGQVLVQATVDVFGAGIPVQGAGRLVLGRDDTLDLIVDRAGVGASAVAVGGEAGARVPDVLRLPPLPMGFHLTSVRTGDGVLVLEASRTPL